MSSAHCCDLFVQEREGYRGIWGRSENKTQLGLMIN